MSNCSMNKKRMLAGLLAGMVCLSGCGSQPAATGSSGPAESEPEQVSQYKGPLYELSFTKLTDLLPQFQEFSRSNSVGGFNSDYCSIEYMTHFAQDNTINIGSYQYCDADFNSLPVEGSSSFLAYHDGYRMFRRGTYDDSQDGGVVDVYDKDMNLVSTTADRFENPSTSCAQICMDTGWIVATEKATGLEGFFNVYTQEWHPVSASESLRCGVPYFNLVTYNSFYSDGLAYVTTSDWVREYYSITNLKHYEREVLGFLDESGQYAFRFEDIPAFDGLLVNLVTGFADGTCIVTARYDDGAFSVPMPYLDEESPFYQVDFVFRIDTKGNVLEEVDMAAFEAKEQEVLEKFGQMDEIEKSREWSYETESIRMADGLTLAVKNPLPAGEIKNADEVGGYTLTDANGTSYPLDEYGVTRAIVTDDARVFLYCTKNPNGETSASSAASAGADALDAVMDSENIPANQEAGFYLMEYRWIAPADYELPKEQKADLSTDGLLRYTDFTGLLFDASFWVDGVNLESNPVIEIGVTCEGTGYGEAAGPIQATESAQRSYSVQKGDCEQFLVDGDVVSEFIGGDLIYRLADPKFLDEAANKSCSWTGSCSWTDENGQIQTKEINIL